MRAEVIFLAFEFRKHLAFPLGLGQFLSSCPRPDALFIVLGGLFFSFLASPRLFPADCTFWTLLISNTTTYTALGLPLPLFVPQFPHVHIGATTHRLVERKKRVHVCTGSCQGAEHEANAASVLALGLSPCLPLTETRRQGAAGGERRGQTARLCVTWESRFPSASLGPGSPAVRGGLDPRSVSQTAQQ